MSSLQKVFVLTRHGERERLVKHSHKLQERGQDPPLSQGALLELSRLAAALRERYLLSPTCSLTSSCLGSVEEVREATLAQSSGLARTLGTAETVLHALFVDANQSSDAGLTLPVPVYSRQDQLDTVLRAYTKCPAHSERILRWYGTREFAQKEEESMQLRHDVHSALSLILPPEDLPEPIDGATPLRDWWNAFDALNVALNNGSRSIGSPIRNELSSLLTEARKLVSWLEARKFGRELTSATCGSSILRKISEAIANAEDGMRLYYYSAHYPTILCTLSALGIAVDSGDSADDWLGRHLLPTGSALVLEVNSDNEVELLLWYDEDEFGANLETLSAGWRPLRTPCGSGGTNDTHCHIDDFRAHVNSQVLASDAEWCSACKNVDLDVCKVELLQGRVPIGGAVAAAILVSGAILAIGCACLMYLNKRWRTKRARNPVVTEIKGWSLPGAVTPPQPEASSGDRRRI